ncbi:MAG: hypothetical protein GEU99_22880 [Luteitalea sp.]|nr:hypothetical protein [Luteitalea sp.]
MAKKAPRNEIISIRLNEERLQTLERYQAQLSERLGRHVSIAEVAFLMIEGVADEVERETARHELLRTPTSSLDRIRKQWNAEHTLPRAEWNLLAEYVQIGAEEDRQIPPVQQPAVPSRDSYLALLDAFEAVYQQRAKKDSRHVWAYFANLDGYRTGARLSDAANEGDQRHEALMSTLALRRERLQVTEGWEYPGHVGRNLLVAIRDEGVEPKKLDQVLAPYWPVLWGLAARGHWIRHEHQPVRLARPYDHDIRQRFILPDPFTTDDVTLSFVSAGPELAAQVRLDRRGVVFLIDSYPKLVEFRAMLDAPVDRSWHGRHMLAVVPKGEASPTRTLSVERSVGVDLSATEWAALGDLFRRAWASPDVQRWLDELHQEYGEHG